LWVDWGDGSDVEWIQHLGTGSTVTTQHTYAGAGEKEIVVSGLLENVTYFKCTDSTFGGDIVGFSVFTALTNLYLNGTVVDGNISGISKLTNITQLRLDGSDVSGDVVALVGMTSITDLRLYNTSVSGDIGDFSVLTSLGVLFVQITSVTGDVGDLAPLTAASSIWVNDTSCGYNTTTLPAWNNTVLKLDNCNLNQSEVDNFLIDLAAAGGTNGTITIAGNNAARSSASDAAKATLLGNGWTVTVNE
jgi:hypothetical protein